jgi:hypothetical protein
VEGKRRCQLVAGQQPPKHKQLQVCTLLFADGPEMCLHSAASWFARAHQLVVSGNTAAYSYAHAALMHVSLHRITHALSGPLFVRTRHGMLSLTFCHCTCRSLSWMNLAPHVRMAARRQLILYSTARVGSQLPTLPRLLQPPQQQGTGYPCSSILRCGFCCVCCATQITHNSTCPVCISCISTTGRYANRTG